MLIYVYTQVLYWLLILMLFTFIHLEEDYPITTFFENKDYDECLTDTSSEIINDDIHLRALSGSKKQFKIMYINTQIEYGVDF